MKKIAAALLLAATTLPALAQVKLGVTAGLNLTKLSVPTSLKNAQVQAQSAEGWFVGPKVYATLPIVGIGADAALLYNQRKATMEVGNTSVANKTLRSVAIPINFRYSIGLSSLASVYVTTGPQFDFNLGGKTWSTILSSSELAKFQTKNSEVSWNVGAGARVLSHLEVGVGYNFGIGKTASLLNDLTGIYSGKPSTRSNSFTVQATYVF